jgi:hypothetical protein
MGGCDVRFVLLPECSQTRLAVTPGWLGQVAESCTVYLDRDVSSAWGGNYSVRVGEGPTDLMSGEYAFALLDSLPDAPGAIAYHSVDGNDVPVLLVGLDQCATLDDLSIAISHELAETAGDESINAWRDDGAGYEWAQELCDAVQARGYAIDNIKVSDFVLPAFFGPGHAGPYTHCGRTGSLMDLPGPFSTAVGGYQIRRASGGGQESIWGDLGIRAQRARHWGSRTFQRGVRA